MPPPTKKDPSLERYLSLVRRFALRPIRSDKELNRAVQMIDALIDRADLEPEEKDYLDVLGDLVERYESKHHPIAPLSDGELLQQLIESHTCTQVEVARQAKIAESTISEVIAGKRKLSRSHIGKLARYFGVQPAAFRFDD